MEIKLMDIQRQHEMYAEEYEKAAITVMRSGKYIGGEEVEAFEREFAAYEGASYGISCGNGSDALLIACRALGIGNGDEVIVPSFTFFATAEAIASTGAVPIFVDCDKDTYCIDIARIEEKITPKTKAVVPVHLYGNCCDMDSLKEIAERNNLYILADCAQSTCTEYRGNRRGTLGDVSCFSFFPTKILGCDGDGGMILTDDEDVAKACRALRMHGSGRDGMETLEKMYRDMDMEWPLNMPLGTTKYYNYIIGFNSRLDSMQAAILRKKLIHLEEFFRLRRKHANYYGELLKHTSYKLPAENRNVKHSYYTYVIQHEKAETIIKELEKRGIQSGIYYPVPMHLQGAFINLNYRKGDMPITETLCRTTFAIPVYPELKEEEQKYIVSTLLEIEKGL